MPSEPAPELPLRRLYQVLFRHKAKTALFFCLVAGGLTTAAFLAPPSYRSEAKLLIQVGRESVTLDPTAAIGESTLDPRTTWENELNSELEIVRSTELIREVVLALGPERVLGRKRAPGNGGSPGWIARTLERARAKATQWIPGRDAPLSAEDRAVLLVASKLDIRLVEHSSVIKIAFEAPERELARAVVATLIERYLDKHFAVHTTPGSFEFFSAETARAEAELRAREEELRELKSSAGISSVEEERRVLLERLADLDRESDLTLAAIDSSAARIASLEEALTSTELAERVVMQETTGSTSPTRDLLRQQLNTLLLEEKSLLQSYDPDTPPVRSVRERIRLATELLAGEESGVSQTVRGINPSRQNVMVALLTEKAERSSLEAKRDVLRPQLVALRSHLGQINDLDLALTRKAREIAVLETRYRRNSTNLEQVRVDQALQHDKISNISVLQAAALPVKSTSMGKKTAALLGLLLGLAGALALAFVLEFLDQSVRSPEDVQERLGLDLLASIPRTRGLRHWNRIAVRPLRGFAELKDCIANGSSGPGTVIAVTSARKREGASTVSANLAHTLAVRGQGPVLLVDASLYSPSVHATFSAPLSPGLAEKVLSAASNGTRASDTPDLRILTGGDVAKVGPSTGKLTQESAVFDRFTRDLERLLDDWRRDHRHVVLDLPSLAEESQVPHVASRCDVVLLVVAAEQGRWQSLRRAREQLEARQARILGVVLNKRRYPIPRWLYRTL